jgi:hypothetical protein
MPLGRIIANREVENKGLEIQVLQGNPRNAKSHGFIWKLGFQEQESIQRRTPFMI